LAALPKSIAGIDTIETLVIDDGSTDKTAKVAKENGVNHIIRIGHNKGLANAFMTGIRAGLKNGADIIVNTDADNQYNAEDIENLVKPILERKADYVIGARPIKDIEHFSPIKKLLQNFGSWIVRVLSGLNVPDAPSGFRALSREAAYKLNVFNQYTYTLETLIQAGHSDIRTLSVPIRVNGETRPSRLFKSMRSYVMRSMVTILRFFYIYRAFAFFMTLAAIIFSCGLLLGFRFLYLNLVLGQTGHIQSVVLSGVLMTVGFMVGTTAILADLISINRKLLEQLKYQLMKNTYGWDDT
jgi:glycosyltransferase involved in cell wall biosynthesis